MPFTQLDFAITINYIIFLSKTHFKFINNIFPITRPRPKYECIKLISMLTFILKEEHITEYLGNLTKSIFTSSIGRLFSLIAKNLRFYTVELVLRSPFFPSFPSSICSPLCSPSHIIHSLISSPPPRLLFIDSLDEEFRG